QHRLELPAVCGRERAVRAECRGTRLAPLDDRAQLAPERDAAVESRADALGRERQAVPRGVAGEEAAVVGHGVAQLVREPGALVALGGAAQVTRELHGGV